MFQTDRLYRDVGNHNYFLGPRVLQGTLQGLFLNLDPNCFKIGKTVSDQVVNLFDVLGDNLGLPD